jgi:hypothetical protein
MQAVEPPAQDRQNRGTEANSSEKLADSSIKQPLRVDGQPGDAILASDDLFFVSGLAIPIFIDEFDAGSLSGSNCFDNSQETSRRSFSKSTMVES